MIGQLLGPVAGLASSWLDAKTTKQAAEAKLKLTEAEAKAKILLSEKTSVADWERIMAENSKSSWKDEFFVIVLSIPLILAFIPGAEGIVDRGFEQLHKAPDWYFYSLGIAISASFGVKGSGRRLYTDENPRDTVPIKFATEKDARDTVAKVKKINKPFARKIQILTVLEQRAKVAGKTKQAQIAKRGKEAIRKKRGKK